MSGTEFAPFAVSHCVDPLAQFTVVGHWYRYEVVLRKQTGGPGAILQAFRKDVTANSPEVKIIDTTVA